MKNLLTALLYAVLVLFAASCQHKDLCVHHPHVVTLRVDFNWQNSPDANPDGMSVYFYPVNGGTPERFDFIGRNGGSIKLTVGKYHVITHNNDTESIMFANNHKFDQYEAYSREGGLFEPIYGSSAAPGPKAKDAEDEKVVITSEMMWGCPAFDVEVTDTGIGYTCIPEKDKDKYESVQLEEHVITLYPCDQMCYYSYEIRNIGNIKYAEQMCASLSGMSGGMTFSTEELYRESVTLPLEARIIRDSAKVRGEFYTFGHHEENEDHHRMLLYVWMKSGDKFYFGSDSEKFNVTTQIHEAPNKRRVHIIIDGLDLPKPIVNGGGYNPSVDDWDTMEEEIVMGN
ncbi:MAG: DUF5119 domain-containing protein [Bacteroidales bacterium]|nr:DUF5119 domain-containing protein [Bacteroidales bacterium]